MIYNLGIVPTKTPDLVQQQEYKSVPLLTFWAIMAGSVAAIYFVSGRRLWTIPVAFYGMIHVNPFKIRASIG